jgi:hypothetical protein
MPGNYPEENIQHLEHGESLKSRIIHSCAHTIYDNADGVKETVNSGTKVFVCAARLAQSYQNEPYQKL